MLKDYLPRTGVDEYTFSTEDEWRPSDIAELPVDIYIRDKKVYIIATIAGVSPQDLDISIEQGTIAIRGVRRRPYDPKVFPPFREECIWGHFSKELIINEKFDVDNVAANLDRGILVLTLPLLDFEE